ncbi:MAG TPA: YetF domain-containing protein [Chthoniobacterales bacterium]|nr:YetF domain-containing protein [Chthoniobacterales bacterium]
MDAFWNFVTVLLGLDAEPKHLTFLQISLRGVIVMAFTLVIMRLGDKRSLSKKSAFDAALLIILASVLARAINGSAAFFPTLGGSAVVVGLHRLMAYFSYKSDGFRRLVKGRPSELVRNGEFIERNMKRDHVAEEDVREDLRLDGEEELARIRVARLECSGDISFIKKE